MKASKPIILSSFPVVQSTSIIFYAMPKSSQDCRYPIVSCPSFSQPTTLESRPEIIERESDSLHLFLSMAECQLPNSIKSYKKKRRAKLALNRLKRRNTSVDTGLLKKTHSSRKLNKNSFKDLNQSSELILYCNSRIEGRVLNSRMHRRASENTGFNQNSNKISITNNVNMQQSTIENEQQSSSIPNVSCDLNCANDEERLCQPTPCANDKSKETQNVVLNSQMNNSTFVSHELDSTLNSQSKSQMKVQENLKEIINKERVLNAFSSSGPFRTPSNTTFKSTSQLSPLKETFRNLKKIQKKNQEFKFPKRLKIGNPINYNFKKRIYSQMVSELGLLNEVKSYYNPSYIFQFNKEDRTDSSRDSPSRMIDNPISRANVQK